MAAATSVPPEDRPEWTHALIAAELAGTGISASQASRILADLELRPHKVRGWLRRADDAQFWAQAAAVCDAYLRPPPDTIVICIDEKTGIQAKYRTYPGRLPAPGRPARREFEYVRNGTLSIIAALHVATGHVVAQAGHPQQLDRVHRLPAPPHPVNRPVARVLTAAGLIRRSLLPPMSQHSPLSTRPRRTGSRPVRCAGSCQHSAPPRRALGADKTVIVLLSLRLYRPSAERSDLRQSSLMSAFQAGMGTIAITIPGSSRARADG